ncbi:hypothetical protein NP233_g3322 [Leucocoprinus birnbaumii]|uniref:DUF6534 domain-containing protein n=1 Tax=Leucocoprinus birnbaumii TaxID=56174 RepID=A0AAD5VZC3_9AGAR|nr:hypothetical protein NP233_g3322 [Leucocoprinus birnbaumii]
MHPADLDLTPTYGVLLIGVLFATFFQGVLTVQAYQYYHNFLEDRLAVKLLVAVLWMLGFGQIILISYIMYHYLVLKWGDVDAIMYWIFPFSLHLFFIAFSILFPQLFFLHRIWILSQRNAWIVGPVLLCVLGTFASVFVEGMFTLIYHPAITNGILGMVLVGALTDILIAAVLCYFVRKRSEDTREMRVTSTLVAQVIRYTVTTSSLTSLVMLACLVSRLVAPKTFINIALHFSAGRTYGNAVLMSLNARRKLRETLEDLEPSFPKILEFSGASSAIQGLPRLGSMTPQYTSQLPTSVTPSVAGGIKVPPNARECLFTTTSPFLVVATSDAHSILRLSCFDSVTFVSLKIFAHDLKFDIE